MHETLHLLESVNLQLARGGAAAASEHRRRRTTDLAALLSLLAACRPTPVELGADGGTEGADTSTTTGTTTGDGSTAASDASASGGTHIDSGGLSTGEGGATDAGSTTEEYTTGGPPWELVKACSSACKRIFACIETPPLFQDPKACKDACVRRVDNEDPDCLVSSVEFGQCVAGLACETLKAGLQPDNLGACKATFDDVERDCRTCPAGVYIDTEDSCMLEEYCGGDNAQGVSCEGETCVCLEGGEQTAECPANGVCQHPDFVRELERMAEECCGFDVNVG